MTGVICRVAVSCILAGLMVCECRAQSDKELFFAFGTVHKVELLFSFRGWYDSLSHHKKMRKDMLPCRVKVDGIMFDSCGAEFKGNSSYYNSSGCKKPMNISFNEFIKGQKCCGMSRINLNNSFNDPTFLREKLFFDFCRMQGVPAPASTFAAVYVNHMYLGLYCVCEQVNNNFLESWFGSSDGNLYKGDPRGNLMRKQDNWNAYSRDYEMKNHRKKNNGSDLVELIRIVGQCGLKGMRDSLEAVFDVELFMKYRAICVLFGNLDSYVYSGHNYYLYHDPADGRFRFIAWDANEAFGLFQMSLNMHGIEQMSIFYIPRPAERLPLLQCLDADSSYRARYTCIVREMLNTSFTVEYLSGKTDSLAAIIQPWAEADSNKMLSNHSFRDNLEHAVINYNYPNGKMIPGLKSFVSNRRQAILNEIGPAK